MGSKRTWKTVEWLAPIVLVCLFAQTLSGQSVGTLSVSNLTLSGGGEYHWEITNANSTAGIGWDLISVDNPGTGDGIVQIDATAGNQYTVRVDSGFEPPVYKKGSYTLRAGKDRPTGKILSGHVVK